MSRGLDATASAGSEIGHDFVSHPVPGLISFLGSTPWGRTLAVRLPAASTPSTWPSNSVETARSWFLPTPTSMQRFRPRWSGSPSSGKNLYGGEPHHRRGSRVRRASFPLHGRGCDRSGRCPSDPNTLVSPVIDDSQLESLRQKIQTARSEGARTVLYGAIQGRLVPAHVFADRRTRWGSPGKRSLAR